MTGRRLRMCLVTSTFSPLIGGAESYALAFAEGMAARGHTMTVVTDGANSSLLRAREFTATDAAWPFRVVRLTEYQQLFSREGGIPWEVLAFGLFPEMERALAADEFDVVITNSLDAAYIGKILALTWGIPWAATFHEQTPEAEAFGPARLRLVYQVLHPDLVLAGSDFYAARAVAQGREDATVRVVHGIDTGQFRPDLDQVQARQRRHLPSAATIVLCVARLTRRKGIANLLQAFAQLKPSWPCLHLVVAGTVNSSDRDHASSLRDETVRLGIEASVTFDESAGPADMPWLFAAADLVVQPSYAEGLGLAVLEGLSSGRAVVTTDLPATRQIARGEDVLVMCQPGDVNGLTTAMDFLLCDPRRRAMLAAAGRQHVLRWFSREVMLQQTEEALLSLTSARRPEEII